MWPFNRKKKSTNNLKDKVSPTAVKEYYQAAGNRQGWVIWLLSIATFLITLLIVLGLFWTGRWVWNKIDSSNDNKPTTTSGERSSDDTSEEDKQSGNNGGSSTPAPNPQPAPTPTPVPSPTQTPNTGPATTGDLPHTGPDSDE